MKSNETLARFENFIEERNLDLFNYKKSSNPHPFRIQRMTEIINQLVQIYNEIEPIGNIPLWLMANKELVKLFEKDSSLKNVHLIIGEDLTSPRSGRIYLPFNL